MGWSDADQPSEGTLPKRGLVDPFILEFLIVLSAWNVRETPEESIIVMRTNYLLDPRHIVQTLVRDFKTGKECKVGVIWWLLPRLDQQRVMHHEPSH